MPTSPDHDPDQPEDGRRGAVGERIREARQAEGMSLRELGSRVGVSASFLSQVELGRAMPSMGTLWTIVSELDLSFDALLGTVTPGAPTPAPADRVREADRIRTVGIPGLQRAGTAPDIRIGGVRWERLTTVDDPLVEFVRVTYSPGSESSPADNMMRHTGWEYMHVLSGQMDLQIGFDRDTVQAGDSLTFEASIPHRISNPYSADCVSIWAVVGRHGYAHPHDISKRLSELGGGPTTGLPFGSSSTHFAE